MTNTPQSSRNASAYNKSIFPQSLISPTPDYFAEKTITQAGDNDIQLKKKTKANAGHYVIGTLIILAVVYLAAKKLD